MTPTHALDTLLAIAVASVDLQGKLREANAGFLHLVPLDGISPSGAHVAPFFIQPDFVTLLHAPVAADGLIHDDLLTLGEFTGQTRSLRARIWREGDALRLVAEHDIDDLERLNSTVSALNVSYAQTQIELAQANLKLQQREARLQQTVADLQLTNTRLVETQRKLVEAEKMASLGVLVAGVAHEINTPLGVSLGATSTLQCKSREIAARFGARTMTQSDLQRHFEMIEASTRLVCSNLDRIGQLVTTFQEMAVLNKPQIKVRFGLKAFLDNVILSFGERLPRDRIAVCIECDPDLEIESYLSDWASILTNLIDNSIKHGFRDRAQGVIEIRARSDGRRLLVNYRDDGAGLTENALQQLFDPFFTTDPQKGIGLGMHLVFNLITQRLRGSISCDSAPGQGARFTIEVPLPAEGAYPE